MTSTITTSALTPDWSVLWWFLVPFVLGLTILVAGATKKNSDTVWIGGTIALLGSMILFFFIAPAKDYEGAMDDVSDQLGYSEVDYESNLQFTAKDEEGYYLKCVLIGTDTQDTYNVVCTK